jgi:alkylation response protein AidB-like acyl-CoA dehydrogenase
MDWSFTDQQEAVAETAEGLFRRMVDAPRVATVEASPDRFDGELWQALADAGLLGLALAEPWGGSGLGMTEVCLLLEAQGRAVAPVPLWATMVLGASAIADWGTDDQQRRWLPAVADGQVRLTAALDEVARSADHRPAAQAEPDGAGWRLHGGLRTVPQAHLAQRVLVPAATADGAVVVALVDPGADGCRLERAETTDRQLWPHLWLDGAAVAADDVLGGAPLGPGPGEPSWPLVARRWLDRAHVGLAAMALGVVEEAVARTATYVNQRQQFGKPLAAFQATLLRAADAYIDTEAMRVTLWEAAWRLDSGRPATEAVSVARWWASEAGQRVVHATQHLHGGIGADVTYPIHRYFLWGKQLELALEGPSAQLARAGRRLVSDHARPAAVASPRSGGPR